MTVNNSSKKEIEPIKVLDVLQGKFFIPLYQRSYDWSDKEITLLLNDISKISGTEYYIGNFIVKKNDNEEYELIDGQQRLTTLYLISLVLQRDNLQNYPKFKSRTKSTRTFEYLKDLDKGSPAKNSKNEYDENIVKAYNCIKDYFIDKNEDDKNNFKEKLDNCKIFLIEVPVHTDLNRYFETMNNRGIQLRQVDIVKFILLSKVSSSEKKRRFNSIWNACSNMDGYLQNHLSNKGESPSSDREFVFGPEWDDMSSLYSNLNAINEGNSSPNGNYVSLKKIIENDKNNPSLENEPETKETDDQHKSQYKSIISFEYFLIYVLYIFCKVRNNQKVEEISFDDKKLKYNYELIDWKDCNVTVFFNTLVCLRFIFDNFVIKSNETSDLGKWTITYLKKEKNNEEFLPRKYKNSDLFEKIQSCLRVTYPYCSKEDWICVLLEDIYHKYCCLNLFDKYHNIDFLKNYNKEIDKTSFEVVTSKLENIAKNRIKSYIDSNKENAFINGTSTPRILFNYLDYLIYKKVKEVSGYKNEIETLQNILGVYDSSLIDGFTFESRNSVEHWYPQNPNNDKITTPEIIDNFGNLALVINRQNSKFSNFMPEDKGKYLSDKNGNYSLKLRIMRKLTNSSSGSKDEKWMNNEGKGLYQDHCKKMIALLTSDLCLVCLANNCVQCLKIRDGKQ